jgi:hypothetical protein
MPVPLESTHPPAHSRTTWVVVRWVSEIPQLLSTQCSLLPCEQCLLWRFMPTSALHVPWSCRLGEGRLPQVPKDAELYLDTDLNPEAWGGSWNSCSKFKRSRKSMETQPSNIGNPKSCFYVSHYSVWNSLLQFSLDTEFHPLFLCGAVSGIFQYFLITVYCILHLDRLYFFVSLEVLFYPQKQNRKITLILNCSSPPFILKSAAL